MLQVVPHKEGTSGHKRTVTTLNHIIEDYKNDAGEDDRVHFDEVLRLIDYFRNERLRNRELMKKGMDVNFDVRGMRQHVFDSELVLRVCDYIKVNIMTVYHLLPFHIIVLCQKGESAHKFKNERFLTIQHFREIKTHFYPTRKR